MIPQLSNGSLRRFNVTACKGKSWLPQDYGTKKYQTLAQEEKELVKAFEGERTYSRNVVETGTSLFKIKEMLQIPVIQEAEDAQKVA